MGKEKSPEMLIQNDTLTKTLTAQVVMRNIYQGDDSFSSKLDKLDAIQRQISEVDTVSEISHTLTHDDDDIVFGQSDDKRKNGNDHLSTSRLKDDMNKTKNDDSTAVKAIVHAQDIISKTQKEHFDNLLTCLGKN